ncbi:MAG: GNAT family N-acetyltransferase [Ilumatobacteraceae bacterium]
MVASPFSLREIGETDRDDVVRLVQESRVSAGKFRGGDVLWEHIDQIDLSTLPGRLAVANDQACGVVLWSCALDVLTVEILFVEESARGVGIGESLVNATVEQARAQGCRRVAGRALPGDRETKNVYERTGLVSQVITVGRNLD